MFMVVCREDRKSNGRKGDYSLATRHIFSRRADAVAYASGICKSRQPLVVETPNPSEYRLELDTVPNKNPDFCPGCGHPTSQSCWSGCPVNGDAAYMLRMMKGENR